MLRKRILPLMALLISVASPLFAQAPTTPAADAVTADAVTAEDSPAYRTYEVKKGDTLWGISKKFIEDPYYWPDLWANNPEIQNPHFISPGQKLRIYSGPIVVVGVEAEKSVPVPEKGVETPEVVSSPPVPAPAPEEPAVAVEASVNIMVPAGVSFVGEDEQGAGGIIFDFPDARHFAGSGDTVFVRMPAEASVAVGDRLQIIQSQDDIIHPVSKKRLGFQVDQVGTLEITALGQELHTAIIRKSYREVERGSWLALRSAVNEQIVLRRATNEMSGVIVATASHRKLQGPSEILFVDIGEKNGLRVGNLLTMTRPRQATDLALGKKKKEALVYPEELIGYALVVETNAESASAVILKSLGPALVGDQVRAQTGQQTR